jgi:plastocyanin domain-containing protein
MPFAADVSSVFLIASIVAVLVIVTWSANARDIHQRQRARLAGDGVQEVEILVHEGFHPNLVRVRAHVPVRLTFRRSEDRPYTAHVHLEEPSLSRFLPLDATSTMIFTPRTAGHFLFTCDEGRYRGHLVVESPRKFSMRHLPAHRETTHQRAPGCESLAASRFNRSEPDCAPADLSTRV